MTAIVLSRNDNWIKYLRLFKGDPPLENFNFNITVNNKGLWTNIPRPTKTIFESWEKNKSDWFDLRIIRLIFFSSPEPENIE